MPHGRQICDVCVPLATIKLEYRRAIAQTPCSRRRQALLWAAPWWHLVRGKCVRPLGRLCGACKLVHFFRGCACPRSQTLRFCTRESFPGGHPFTSTESHSPTSPLAGVLPGVCPPFCTCELSAGTGSSQVQKRYPGRRKTPARWGGALRGSVRVNGCPPSRRSRTEPSRQTARVARRSAPTQREPPLLQGVATGAEAMPLLDVWTNALATRTCRNDGQSPRGKCIIVNGFTTICECDESPFYELRSKVPRDNTKQTIRHLKRRAWIPGVRIDRHLTRGATRVVVTHYSIPSLKSRVL
jgi:hypothetical protein